MKLFPLQEGEIRQKSYEDFIWYVHLLFYLFLFNPLIKSRVIPIPINRLIYLCLGANWGKSTYTSGLVVDPSLTYIGNFTLMGQDSIVSPHSIEGPRLYIQRVRIGDRVTIGAKSIVLPGVTIGNDAIVAAGSVIKKDTTIKDGEIWGGIPAKRIGIHLPDQNQKKKTT